MAGTKDQARFVFFKYVPPKKSGKPAKDNPNTNQVVAGDQKTALYGLSAPERPGYPDEPECRLEQEHPQPVDSSETLAAQEQAEHPELSASPEPQECRETQGDPELQESDEATEEPGTQKFPGLPEIPEFPEVPELPECPEFPEEPEGPGGPCGKGAITHVIQAGDTFWKLAKRYGTTVDAIAAANPEADPLNLQIGQTICIPAGIPGAKG